MTPERWARVTELFDAASQLPTAARDAWLDATGADAELRAEVRAMLEAFETDPGFLEQPADPGPALDDTMTDALIGRRLGAWRLTRQIGRGGMGVVYEARRDDQEFDRAVAVKILPAWSVGFAERFRTERRVLAALDHPGIARLLDSGTSDDGIAWFVMELVAGDPVTTWTTTRRLAVRERVALVERICDAVAYAHRHLVVHRDLKPGNILVTAEGQPKLLDFGIATLLSEEDGRSAGTTRTGHASFTPEFASPEQIRGERVTTASDVYSLGVLLYLLLAGKHPYALAGLSPLDVMRTVCEVEPTPPSRVAAEDDRRALAGDLDAVAGKALRKAPGERYASVAELAADLRAWRAGYPVVAAPASVGYRARRFIRRNRKAVAAAAALVVALAGGGAATAWQARIAQAERDKAQNRFRQVQEFSRSLLFDVHDALTPVPGAMGARVLLLNRATQFLDGLSADAGSDDALKAELAEGYRRLGRLQGSSIEAGGIGDTAAAKLSLEQAARLAEEAIAARPDAVDRLTLNMRIQYQAEQNLRRRGEFAAADGPHARLLALAEQTLRRFPDDADAQLGAAEAYSNLGVGRTGRKDDDGALAYYEQSLRLFDRLPAALRGQDETVRLHAMALRRMGALSWVKMRLAPAEAYYRKALALQDDALARDPANAAKRLELHTTLGDLGGVLNQGGRVDEAITLWTRGLAIAEEARAADPVNLGAADAVALIRARIGEAAREAGRHDEAVTHLRAVVALRDASARRLGSAPDAIGERAYARLYLARALLDAADGGAGAARASLVAEARTLMRATPRTDVVKPIRSVPVAYFHEQYDAVLARLGGRKGS